MIQPIQGITPIKYNKDDESTTQEGKLNNQIIRHRKLSFKGHWPNYTHSGIKYNNHHEVPEGTGEKLDFII